MTQPDEPIPCPFLGCLDHAGEWFDVPGGTPEQGFAGIPPRFRVCAEHLAFLERISVLVDEDNRVHEIPRGRES